MDFQHPNLCLGEAAVNASKPSAGKLSMDPEIERQNREELCSFGGWSM